MSKIVKSISPEFRVYLYGASNLWLSRQAALAAVRRRFKKPIEICLACGPGRSYGLKAGNPLVRYRPLIDIEFPRRPPIASLAIIGDAGNDIVYAQSPQTTLEWIEKLAQKLEKSKAQVVISGIPAQSLRRLPKLIFLLLRRLYYQNQALSYSQILERLEELEQGLIELCAKNGYIFLDTDPSWYSFDRVHLRLGAHAICWENWLERLYPALDKPYKIKFSDLFSLKPADSWVRGERRYHDGLYDHVMPETLIWVR